MSDRGFTARDTAVVCEGFCPIDAKRGSLIELERHELRDESGPVALGWCRECRRGWRVIGRSIRCYRSMGGWLGYERPVANGDLLLPLLWVDYHPEAEGQYDKEVSR